MPHARLALVLAVATGAVNLGELAYFGDGYLVHEILAILLWAVLPPLAACWLATRFVRSAAAAKILCAGLGLALALGLLGAWEITWGSARDEPLKGLIVITVPAYQNILLLTTLVLAFIVEWRLKASSSGQ